MQRNHQNTRRAHCDSGRYGHGKPKVYPGAPLTVRCLDEVPCVVVGLAVYKRPNHNEISKQNTSGQKTCNVVYDEIQYVVHMWPSRRCIFYCGNEQQI